MKSTLSLLLVLLSLSSGITVAGEVGVTVAFSDKDISLIQAWYRDHGDGPQGAGKSKQKGAGSLPPGIAKNLQRGKPLPPGIAKQVLPSGLVELLGPPPRGYERIYVDGRVLLVHIATQVIHDALEDLILR